MILLTHGHLTAGAMGCAGIWMCPPICQKEDSLILFPSGDDVWHTYLNVRVPIDHEEDGFEIMLGQTHLKFISTPGHTPGQGCWYDENDIIVGDTLFAGSIGRTDFPMSDPQLMKESLRRLFKLPGHLRVHSGHGPMTTLETELRSNPFVGTFVRRGCQWVDHSAGK